MLHTIKQWVPSWMLSAYHYALAIFATLWYWFPSRRLVVIGVTGTNGKTTTSYLIAKALQASGHKTGCATTALIKIGEKETLNTSKMTMQGRFALQRMLREMVDADCRYAVIETSSQGLIQHRHLGIAYDIAVFTNLTPEHIEAHGGFEAYKRAKRLLFERVAATAPKRIDGLEIPHGAILNGDDPYAAYYAETPGLTGVRFFSVREGKEWTAERLELSERGSAFAVQGHAVRLSLPGLFNVENAMAALTVADALHIPLEGAIWEIEQVRHVPGRMEFVDVGQPWTVLIDYAPEPESFRRLYEAIQGMPKRRVIHVFGSCGGGRDVARRPVLGALGAQQADILVVTNEDPYDDDPEAIIKQVAEGALEQGKVLGESLFTITDRREAIQFAMGLAQAGDLVVMTGKGCETWMCVAQGEKIPWNERAVAEEAIRQAMDEKRGTSDRFS